MEEERILDTMSGEAEDREDATWTCCGGIRLLETDRCPMCGEEY